MTPGRGPLQERPTSDLVIIFLAGVVGVILVMSLLAFVLIEIYRPETSTQVLAARVGTITSSLVGAIVGYVAGRRENGGSRCESQVASTPPASPGEQPRPPT